MARPHPSLGYALGLVPALLLAAIHLAWLRAPLVSRIDEADRRIAEAERLGRSGQSELATARAQSAELTRLATEREALEARKRELLNTWIRPDERVTTVGEISSVFQRRGVQIRKSSFEPKEDGPTPGPMLMRLARTMTRWGASAPELWKLEMRASYPSLIAALEECAKLEAFGLIVSLSADTTRSLEALDFTVWMWI